ncbi:hypothetical protein HAX54_007400, partial [Datura stramonium]|nr:hypothetical protein [Datura stramonium]
MKTSALPAHATSHATRKHLDTLPCARCQALGTILCATWQKDYHKARREASSFWCDSRGDATLERRVGMGDVARGFIRSK